MNTRFTILLAVIVMVAIVAGTFLLGISPRLSESAAADEERETVEAQNAVHQAELDRLIDLNERLTELQAELAQIRTAIPGAADTSRFYRELEAIAAATGVRFTNIALSVPEAYGGGEEADPEAAPAYELHPELTAALGSVSENNFFVIPAQFGITGGYTQVLEALSRLQNNPRYVLVHGVTIEEGLPGGDAEVTANLEGQLFILLDEADVRVAPEPEAAPVAEAAAG